MARKTEAGPKSVADTVKTFEARFHKARLHKDEFPKAYDDMLNAVFMIAVLSGQVVPPARGMRSFREELLLTIKLILQTNPRIAPRAAAAELGKRVPGGVSKP